MNLEMSVDLTEITEETADRGRPVPGWYRCVVDDVKEDEKTDGPLNFVFKITAGPFKGSLIYDKLKDPNMAEDDDKAKKAKAKIACLGKRLGVISREDFGRMPNVNWTDTIGRECFIKFQIRKFPGDDGTEQEWAGPEQGGIYALDDERVPIEVRTGKPATPVPPASRTGHKGTAQPTAVQSRVSAPPPGRKAQDLDDL